MRQRVVVAAVAVTVLLVAAACGSSKPSAGTTSGAIRSVGADGRTITVGVLTDLTGPAASGDKTFLNGVKAGVALAKREGYTVNLVVGDAQTSPSGALAAAQHMVEEDHVPVVLAQSSLTFAAAPYLMSHDIPVIGEAEDAGEWGTDLNMFAIGGALHIAAVTTTLGQLFKLLGANTVGALGYGISPSSADSAREAIRSAEAAGLKSGYLNASFPFGSTNVQPVALAMKNAGVDAFYASVDPNTGFSLIQALRQEGADLKAAVLPDGYGADTLQAGPGALADAQNVYFMLGYEPVEMNTAATKQLVADLAATGTTGVPTYGEYNGYISVGLLLKAWKAAGSATSTALTSALKNIHSWDALGLWGGRTIDINDRADVLLTSQCTWVTKLVGSDFQLVAGADPLCGTTMNGVTVGS